MKPVWPTIRCDGLTLRPETSHGRISTSSVSISSNERSPLSARVTSWNCTTVGTKARKMPPGTSARSAWGTTCHGSGRSSTTRSSSVSSKPSYTSPFLNVTHEWSGSMYATFARARAVMSSRTS